MELTDEQEIVCSSIVNEIRKYFDQDYHKGIHGPIFVVSGFAGTGKTSVLIEIKKRLENISCALCAYTGKASSILKEKLGEIPKYCDRVGTIHSLIYIPVITNIDGKPVITEWKKTSEISQQVIFVDEASMVDYKIYEDLVSYRTPIIFFGDQGQLPPISSNTFSIFNLTNIHSYKLETIHRQALENPIIELSMRVRQDGFIPIKRFSDSVIKVHQKRDISLFYKILNDITEFTQDMIVLCGFNKTRLGINKQIRTRKGFTENFPYPTDRMICLKNNHLTDVMNGQLGTFLMGFYRHENLIEGTIQMDYCDVYYESLFDDRTLNTETYNHIYDLYDIKKLKKLTAKLGFSNIDFFDFGYCISVHRSQGSEFNKVILFEERSSYWDDDYYKRWLYTAVTRAKEKLVIFGS